MGKSSVLFNPDFLLPPKASTVQNRTEEGGFIGYVKYPPACAVRKLLVFYDQLPLYNQISC